MTQHSQIISQLLRGQTPGLAAWMAEPVDEVLALNYLKTVQHHALHGLHCAQTVFALRLGELIIRYWAGKDIEAGYKNLLVLLESQHEQSILEMCIGQLLIAQKLSRAWTHLDRGFQLATHLLEPKDYFLVLKRHELLRQLPLRQVKCEPAGLDSLLAEARIIVSLRGKGTPRGNTGPKHRDTLG